MSDPLRPQRLSEIIGQRPLVDRLGILLTAAKARGEAAPHVLLAGPPGLGKTTLAHVIANEMGSAAHVLMGPTIEKPQDLTNALLRVQPRDVIFVDEVHSASKSALECLYPAMEDSTVCVSIDCKTHVTAFQVPLPPFTMIGATTQPGTLEGPLRDRFGTHLALSYYEPADMATILRINADKLGLPFDREAIALLASRCRGTPRVGNHLLRFSRDFAQVRADGRLTVAVAQAALDAQGIDSLGLNPQDREFLRVIIRTYGGGPVGADALAATLGVKTDTIAGIIEPHLLRLELIARTARGRRSTDAAARHLASVAA